MNCMTKNAYTKKLVIIINVLVTLERKLRVEAITLTSNINLTPSELFGVVGNAISDSVLYKCNDYSVKRIKKNTYLAYVKDVTLPFFVMGNEDDVLDYIDALGRKDEKNGN